MSSPVFTGSGVALITPMQEDGSVNYKKLGEEIRQALTQVRKDVREKIEQAAAPKAAVTCPYCGATTTPDASGCCEYCGGAVG